MFRVLFNNLRKIKLGLLESTVLSIQEVFSSFTGKKRKSLLKEFNISSVNWKLCTKNGEIYRNNLKGKHAPRRIKETTFVSSFNDLFNIVHANVFAMMMIDEDKLFLTLQRPKRLTWICGWNWF